MPIKMFKRIKIQQRDWSRDSPHLVYLSISYVLFIISSQVIIVESSYDEIDSTWQSNAQTSVLNERDLSQKQGEVPSAPNRLEKLAQDGKNQAIDEQVQNINNGAGLEKLAQSLEEPKLKFATLDAPSSLPNQHSKGSNIYLNILRSKDSNDDEQRRTKTSAGGGIERDEEEEEEDREGEVRKAEQERQQTTLSISREDQQQKKGKQS